MIWWLASYPKSGNTWVRAFLTNLRSEPAGQTTALSLAGGPLLSGRALFDAMTDCPSIEMTEEEIDLARPHVSRRLAAESGEAIFVKTHAAFRRAVDGRPIFPEDATRGAVLIVRDPRDVAVSLAEFLGWSVDSAIERMNSDDACLNPQSEASAAMLPERMMSWSGHTQSWLAGPRFPVCVVRYESLLEDPMGAFGGLARFLGLPADEAALARAVHGSRFEALRLSEEREGFALRQRSGSPFFRSGTAGQWRAVLTDAQARRIGSAHGDLMDKLGYSR